jgi:hypothetical protein
MVGPRLPYKLGMDSTPENALEEIPELDASPLQEGRPNVPPFPLERLPPAWARWIAEGAEAAGTAVDYVVQSVLAAVAALCGAGVRVQVMQGWEEPLVLWCAVVGSPSSGKSRALGLVRDILGILEDGLRDDDAVRRGEHSARLQQARLADERWRDNCETAYRNGLPLPHRPPEAAFDRPFVPSQMVVADATIEALADIVWGNPRGVILWRDELTAWLSNPGRYANGGGDRAYFLEAWAAAGVTINPGSRVESLHLPRFPVSVIGSIQPARLAGTLEGSVDGMSARFLYAWPPRTKHRSLIERPAAREDDALGLLQNIVLAVGTAEAPAVLAFDSAALCTLDTFLGRLDGVIEQAEGLEESWLGKGRGVIARLAGILSLLAWSESSRPDPPRRIGVEAVANAIALWSGYFHPHAVTVFSHCSRTDRHVRRGAGRSIRRRTLEKRCAKCVGLSAQGAKARRKIKPPGVAGGHGLASKGEEG